MRKKKRLLMAWNGGKDCSQALHLLRESEEYDVIGLFQIAGAERNLQHGILTSLIKAQADSLGLPLYQYTVGWNHKSLSRTWEEYKKRVIMDPQLHKALHKTRADYLGSGDIDPSGFFFLKGVLSRFGSLKPVCPLIDTSVDPKLSNVEKRKSMRRHSLNLAHSFVDQGFKAVVIKADTRVKRISKENKEFHLHVLGRQYDKIFIAELGKEIDPCGEFYEFHSFVYDGPGFKDPVRFKKGCVRYVSEMNWQMQAMLDLIPYEERRGFSCRVI